MAASQAILDVVRASLKSYGLDIVHPFAASVVASMKNFPKVKNSRSMCLLIGNSSALWPHVVRFAKSHPLEPNPVDVHCANAVEQALRLTLPLSSPSVVPTVRWVHDMRSDVLLDFMGLAHGSGLAPRIPSAYLTWHPVFGTWFALRALIVFDAENTLFDALDESTKKELVQHAEQARQGVAAIHLDDERVRLMISRGAAWDEWVALRDSLCLPHQREVVRYPEPMIRYHYTGDRKSLTDV
jgi:methylmalonic aciduria homocystinuria type C protein